MWQLRIRERAPAKHESVAAGFVLALVEIVDGPDVAVGDDRNV